MLVSENQMVMMPMLLTVAPQTGKTLLWWLHVIPLWASQLLKES